MGKSDDDKVTLTRSELKDLIADQVRLAMASTSEDGKFAAQIASRKGTDREPLPTTRIHGVVSETGATFDVTVDHMGKVVSLVDYKEPSGIDLHQDDGGLVPRGFPIRDAVGQFTSSYKQWRYESFWAHDINSIVGKPLPAHLARRAA